VHLVGFIVKKFVTMHSHMNVKFSWINVISRKGDFVNKVIIHRTAYK